MADPRTPVFFDALPTEMKVNVFAFVRTRSDKKTVCLVSKEWQALMAPSLWGHFVSNFRPLPTLSLAAVLRPHSNILRHARMLHVRRPISPSSDQSGDAALEATLKFIVGALPKDSLRSFTSDVTLSASFFVYLLQHQGHLETFNCRMNYAHRNIPPEVSSIGQATWLTSSLRHLKGLGLYFDPDCSSSADDIRALIKGTDYVEFLDLRSLKGRTLLEVAYKSIFGESELDSLTAPMFSKLSKLKFHHMDFAIAPTTLLSHINISNLTAICIRRCFYAASLLNAIAAHYSREACNLRSLVVLLGGYRGSAAIDALQALERVLNCVPPLHSIFLDSGSARTINVSCILRHSSRLRALGLLNGRTKQRPHLAYEHLSKLLRACAELRQLAIHLCPVDLGPIENVGFGFTLGGDSQASQTELESSLDAIAALPNLHSLRLPPLPTIDFHSPSIVPCFNGHMEIDDIHVGLVQIVMERYAAQVMRYMTERGSKIKVLTISPERKPSSRPRKDENGHRWPDYFYLLGKTTNARGIEQVTALPIAQCGAEMPESAILFD